MSAHDDDIKEWMDSHNLTYLLDLLSKKIEIPEDQYDKTIMLNGCSIQIRYPDKTIYLTKEELETSITIAQEFRAFAISTMWL